MSSSIDEPFILRRAIVSDNHALAQLNRHAFLQTYLEDFHLSVSQDNIDAHFRNTMTPEIFLQKLTDPQQATWVIENTLNHELIAFLNAGPCFLPHSDVSQGEDGEIDRLYVLRDQQGKGWGPWLIKEALSWFNTQYSSRPIWLGVWSGNIKAQKLFKQYGFQIVGDRDYRVGTHRFDSFIMRRDNSP